MEPVFAEVCGTGVGLQLDDFGTSSDTIVRSTVALAHSRGLQVIAEGIEESRQLRRLGTLGCECGQGFLFSPALSAEATRELLANWSPAQAVRLAQAVSTG